MSTFEERMETKLDNIGTTTTETATKVASIEKQNANQFERIQANEQAIAGHKVEIINLKEHRAGRNWAARFLMRIFLGGI